MLLLCVHISGDKGEMTDDFSKLIRNRIKAHQEQTEALILAQEERMSAVMCDLAKMVSKLSSTPAFEPFNSSLEQNFSSCGVTNPEENKFKLLPWIGSETFAVLGKIRPGFEADLSYHEITKLLSDFSDKEMYFIHARIEFSRYLLKPDQSYKEWAAELQSISKRCKFQCPKKDCKCSLIDENIRDAIILRTSHKNV
ncbi:hypothetical protein RF11_11103 [Thelohanellus kitauei]|uniref:Retrotransposon gag domain-containing protein n=1 Tax=Thelohanellus kitauei TaxID=669202 RepID=A0A0C2N695_THEKT|nr:hypothetical protein RF11_11103 [Thelohanellus kitauei]